METGDGYPDITLLPRIAHFFDISVDELLGTDEVAREDDINTFLKKLGNSGSSKEAWQQKLALAKEYYAKHPKNYEIMYELSEAIVNNMDTIDDNLELLCELHQAIMSDCTDEYYRRASFHHMCYAAPDEKLDDQIDKSGAERAQAISIGELREERYLLQHRYDEYRRERNATDLLIFMQYLGRSNMAYYRPDADSAIFSEPERIAAWELHKMHILEHFDVGCTEEHNIPEAWCGCYAEFSLKAAGALIGCGRFEEGFARLNATFPLYERWNSIPDGKQMDVGNPAIFGGALVNKNTDKCVVNITFPDGHVVWTPYLWLFWQTKGDIFSALTKWPWFENVKQDSRYLAAYERAKIMAETE